MPARSERIGRYLEIVANLRRGLSAAEDARSVSQLLVRAAAELGFDYVTMAEHGDLADPQRALALISNYPEGWQGHFTAQRLDRIDPVQQACRSRVSGFRWSALHALIELRPQQVALLKDSRRYGLGDGFTVPLHLPGARAASCSFAVGGRVELPREALWAAELVARTAYDHLRMSTEALGRAIRLSPQQRACVALMARGLTDRGIARRLSLSEETVTKYLNAARRRYGFARRTQLIAAALRDGVIGYEDLALD